MSDTELETAIEAAISGDAQAMEAVLLQYMPLINKASMVDGCMDEDCRQQILMSLIIAIGKFSM